MIDPALVQNACFSADTVAMKPYRTHAEETRAIVTRALEALEANGMIQVVPKEQWPEYYVPEPPYKPFGFEENKIPEDKTLEHEPNIGSTVETIQGWAAIRPDGTLIEKYPTKGEAEGAVRADYKARGEQQA